MIEDGGGEDEAIAGLLHDAVEDQGGQPTLEIIRSRFGQRIADIIEACSDADTLPKPPWRERKERYIEHLRRADESVLRVSLADKLHNARAILLDYRALGEELWIRFNATRDDTLWYYHAVLDVLRGRLRSPDDTDGIRTADVAALPHGRFVQFSHRFSLDRYEPDTLSICVSSQFWVFALCLPG